MSVFCSHSFIGQASIFRNPDWKLVFDVNPLCKKKDCEFCDTSKEFIARELAWTLVGSMKRICRSRRHLLPVYNGSR